MLMFWRIFTERTKEVILIMDGVWGTNDTQKVLDFLTANKCDWKIKHDGIVSSNFYTRVELYNISHFEYRVILLVSKIKHWHVTPGL